MIPRRKIKKRGPRRNKRNNRERNTIQDNIQPKIKNDLFTSRFLLIFAAIAMGLCFTYIYLITFVKIPEENQRYADVCLGFLLGTFMATIVQFFFGSSNSSRDKDNDLRYISKQYQDAMGKLRTISDITSAMYDDEDDYIDEDENENEEDEPFKDTF